MYNYLLLLYWLSEFTAHKASLCLSNSLSCKFYVWWNKKSFLCSWNFHYKKNDVEQQSKVAELGWCFQDSSTWKPRVGLICRFAVRNSTLRCKVKFAVTDLLFINCWGHENGAHLYTWCHCNLSCGRSNFSAMFLKILHGLLDAIKMDKYTT